jgi:hypothetical protein
MGRAETSASWKGMNNRAHMHLVRTSASISPYDLPGSTRSGCTQRAPPPEGGGCANGYGGVCG